MIAIKSLNLVVRFLLELCALAALGVWGFTTGGNRTFTRVALGLGVPLIAAVVWGMFGSPAAPLPAPGALRVLLEIVIFGAAVVALFAIGQPVLAVAFGIVTLANGILMAVWDQR